MKFCLSADKSVSVVLTLVQYLPKELLCLAESLSYPSHSQDKVFLLDIRIIGRRQRLAEGWESSTSGWRSAVPRSAAALQPCSDAGISGTLCYSGRVSLLGKNMGFQGLFAAGDL